MMKFQLSKFKQGLAIGIVLGIVVIASIIIIIIPKLDSKSPHWCYNTGDQVLSVEISHDGMFYLAGTRTGLFLFKKSLATPIWEYPNIDHAYPVTISADGKYMAAVDWDNLHAFSRVNNTQVTHCLNISSEWWFDIDFSLNGEYFVATCYKTLYLYSVYNFEPIWSFTNNSLIFKTEISADGSSIVALDDKFLYFFSKLNNNTLWNYSLQSWGVASQIALSANGEYIVYGGWDSRLMLFHKDNPIPIWIINLSDHIYCVDISYDGFYLTAGCSDGTIYFFNRLTSVPLWNISTPWPVNSISISSNGMRVAAISTVSYGGIPEIEYPPPEGELNVFRTDIRLLMLYYDFKSYVYSCDISSDGEEVLVGVLDGRICLFKV